MIFSFFYLKKNKAMEVDDKPEDQFNDIGWKKK